MNKHIKAFEEEIIERLSRSYYDELLYFSVTAPNSLINFNDVLLLKKGQKYIRHTDLIFQKAIGNLFAGLFNSKGMPSQVRRTDGGNGRGVYIQPLKTNVHFLGQEKFVNFPRVPWMDFGESRGGFDLYTVTIKNDEVGRDFIEKANALLQEKNITTKSFMLLEDFVVKYLGTPVWSEIEATLARIEKEAKN